MRIVLLILTFLFSTNSFGQVFNLIRSIDTNDATNILINIERLLDTDIDSNYSHTGTMSIDSNIVTMNTLRCIDDLCIKDNRQLKIINANNSIVFFEVLNDDSDFPFSMMSILSLNPLMLLEVNRDGTVLFTKWIPVTN